MSLRVDPLLQLINRAKHDKRFLLTQVKKCMNFASVFKLQGKFLKSLMVKLRENIPPGLHYDHGQRSTVYEEDCSGGGTGYSGSLWI